MQIRVYANEKTKRKMELFAKKNEKILFLPIFSVRDGREKGGGGTVGVFYGCNLRDSRTHNWDAARSRFFLAADREKTSRQNSRACEFCIDQRKKSEKTDDGPVRWIDKRRARYFVMAFPLSLSRLPSFSYFYSFNWIHKYSMYELLTGAVRDTQQETLSIDNWSPVQQEKNKIGEQNKQMTKQKIQKRNQ